MRRFLRFFKYAGQALTERTKLCLIAALVVFGAMSWALQHVQVVTSADGKEYKHLAVDTTPAADGSEKVERLVSVYSYYYDVVLGVGFAIIMATSLNLVNGHTGQFSLGHAGFMAVGAYIGSIVSLGKTLPLVDYATFSSVDFGAWFDSGNTQSVWEHLLKDGTSLLMIVLQAVGWVLGFLLNCVIGILNGAIGATNVLPEVLKFPAALLVGGVMAGFTGLVVGVPSLRLRGDYLAIVTLGFNEIIRVLVQNCKPLGAAVGLNGIPQQTNFFWTFAFVAITIYVVYNLVNSTYGRGFLAVRDDEIAAEAMGINTTRYKVLAFVIAAFFAGIAGGLYAHYKQAINADGFNFLRSVDVVVIVIIGGMGSIWGVTFAAILLTLIPEWLRMLAHSEWLVNNTKHLTSAMAPDQQDFILRRVQDFFGNRMIFFSIILIVVMLVRPQGLCGVKTLKKGGGK